VISIPTLETSRLLLRPFVPADAPSVKSLAGTPEVALTTLNIPHPYPDGVAETWIASHAGTWDDGRSLTLAVATAGEGLVGAVGLQVDATHERGEIGYWIGFPYWNRGYATEAARELVRFAFDHLKLNRIQASYLVRNPSSGRVMEKLGMRHEGVRRQYLLLRGTFEDVGIYAMLKSDRAGMAPPEG
jgi:ribosomal-protein-alanine N-acetyltransferase